MRKSIAIFFIVIFTALVSAPTIILSMDSSIDTSIFYSVNEEEEKEGVKIVFEIAVEDFDGLFTCQDKETNVIYTYKTYQRPHLNLISPPPEKVLV